jgi:zinc transport system substrate-binding protein
MKKKIILILLLTALLFPGCDQTNSPVMDNTQVDGAATTNDALTPAGAENIDSRNISIVCTIFPQYDWVRQIVGELISGFDLILLGNRLDFHNYQPVMDDIVTITNCDLFIYIGGASDRWVGDVLAGTINPNIVVIDLLAALDKAASAGELISGDVDEHRHEREHNGHEHRNHGHSAEIDEHIWLSLNNAALFSQLIAEALVSLDPANSSIYMANLAAYLAEISALDLKYREVINNAETLTILCGDRFPFYHLATDYGLTYYTAFPGCLTESEASFETIIYLAGKADELRLKNLIVTESSDYLVAQAIINNTTAKDAKIKVLNSLQSVTATEAGQTTYLAVMAENLKVLAEVLK